MQADTVSVQKPFQDRRQYRVSFFQRPYVWNKEDQWERLWADISEKADIRADGDQPAVLEPQQRQSLIGVETLNIIDGQQRFTTLQYFLASLAIVLREEKQATLLSIVEGCLRKANTDTMQMPEIEIFKVWPTFRDRTNFHLAMDATSPAVCPILRRRSNNRRTAWLCIMRYSVGRHVKDDRCTMRPLRFSKPVSRPVSIVCLGEDFIRWWWRRSELPGCSMVLKSHLRDLSLAPSKRAPACASPRPTSALRRAFISRARSLARLALDG